MSRPVSRLVHGTPAGYNNWACRCPACTRAASDARRAWLASLQDRPSADIPHGTPAGYRNWGCRCDACRGARAAEARRDRARQLQLRTVVMSVLLGLCLGIGGTDAAIIAHRGGHIAPPAVVAPSPQPNPSPVLTAATPGGSR